MLLFLGFALLAGAAFSLAGFVLKLNPKATADSVRTKLLAAGMTERISVNAFLAAKGALAIGGLVFGALVGLPSGPAMGLFLTVGGAFVGFVMPDFVLTAKARVRREAIRSEL